MSKKVKKKLIDPAPCKAELPRADSLECLRIERKMIRTAYELMLSGPGIPLNNQTGSVRRRIVTDLLLICALPERHTINTDLLLAASLLISYNDRSAIAILQAVDEHDYRDMIKRAKQNTKVKK